MAIKKITDIYKGYFQKSKVFLYPILGSKHSDIKPINTYITSNKEHKYKLLCLFKLEDNIEFIEFEKKYLLNNKLFEDYIQITETEGLYIFDLSNYQEDFDSFLEGKYSRFSDKLKNRIKQYYGINSANYAFIETYLFPENFFALYARFLTVNQEDKPEMFRLLTEVGELCSKPDLIKEHISI